MCDQCAVRYWFVEGWLDQLQWQCSVVIRWIVIVVIVIDIVIRWIGIVEGLLDQLQWQCGVVIRWMVLVLLVLLVLLALVLLRAGSAAAAV